LSFSRDGEWLTYVTYPGPKLWRARSDGSQRLQLTGDSLRVGLPRWSPDGKQIAFIASKAGGLWKLYVISADGGTPQQVLDEPDYEWDPNWSPDGGMLVFGQSTAAANPQIHLVNLETRTMTALPGSKGMYSPRWSPDGRYIATLSVDASKLWLFDRDTQKWRLLDSQRLIGYPSWSHEGRYIYYSNALEKGATFYRVRIADGNVERVANVNFPRGLAFGTFGWWTGLAPDDSPLLLRDTSIQQIYALDVELP
jgi:Tol biopolymer transport system component